HRLSVHGLPSSQGTGVPGRQVPSAGLQVSTPLQMLLSLHTVGTPTHVPPTQVSPVVQALPSSQGPVATACKQPSVASQRSVVHGLPSSQSSGVPGWHPATGSQVSTPLQTSVSPHGTTVPLHTPPRHTSPVVQTDPSSQGRLLSTNRQPSTESQLSS